MRLKKLWIDGFKNLNNFEIDLESRDGITVLIGNNASGKSNILEAISAIFANIHNPKIKNDFDYCLIYSINYVDINISKDKSNITYQVKKHIKVIDKNDNHLSKSPETPTYKETSKTKLLNNNYVPQVIALYSGEDYRLWENYYEPFYKKFKQNILKNNSPIKQYMFYIDGKYWDTALITFLYSSLDNLQKFTNNIFNNRKVKKIVLDLNIKNYQKHDKKQTINYLITFIGKLTREIGIVDFENGYYKLDVAQFRTAYLGFEKEFFINLSIANTLNKPSTKLIDEIIINLEDGSTTKDLSEGQKKQILLKLCLEVLADENSLILFDEPDAHIHIANKKLIPEMLKEYEGKREVILTTHSPTLAHSFENKHLAYVENGEIDKNYNIQDELLNDISGGVMGESEKILFLSSKPLVLLVEGNDDKKHIETAFQKLKLKLKENYTDLVFDVFSLNGANNIAIFMNSIKSSVFRDKNKTYIGIFDYDKKGKECSGICDKKTSGKLKKWRKLLKDNDDKNQGIEAGYFHMYLPYNTVDTDYEIENMYSIEKQKESWEYAIKTEKNDINLKQLKNNSKVWLAKNCVDFMPKEFESFKKLFDLILEIKTSNSKK